MSHETNATSPRQEPEGSLARRESALRILELLGPSRLVFVTEEMPARLYAIAGSLLNAPTEEFRRIQLEAAIEYALVSTEDKRVLPRRVSSVLSPGHLGELGRLLNAADPPTAPATGAADWPNAPSAPTATSHHVDQRTTAIRALGPARRSFRRGLLARRNTPSRTPRRTPRPPPRGSARELRVVPPLRTRASIEASVADADLFLCNVRLGQSTLRTRCPSLRRTVTAGQDARGLRSALTTPPT